MEVWEVIVRSSNNTDGEISSNNLKIDPTASLDVNPLNTEPADELASAVTVLFVLLATMANSPNKVPVFPFGPKSAAKFPSLLLKE